MSNFYSLFVPNKPSIAAVTIDPEGQPLLHKFMTEYFFGYFKGVQQIKPFAHAGLMLEEIDGEAFDDKCLTADEDFTISFDNIQDYLQNVISNFCEDTIVVCSHYS